MSEQHDEFDYIIVGAGAAGCVMANRLSADPGCQVLLLEAGPPDDDPAIHAVEVPSLFQAWKPELGWGFSTEPERYLNGRQMPLIQGRVEGGGTSVNGRIFIRGNRRDFDHWNYLGNEGWSFADVLPYFKKSEDYKGPPSELRGVGGPLSVIDLPKDRRTPASEAFIEAAVELGFKGNWDFNGPQQEGGAGFVQSTTTADFKRASASTAYLDPIRGRSNFALRTGALVARILLERTRAVGVEYRRNGSLQQAHARREVILSAGPMNSPKILMLSGIGPADHLRSHGIQVAVDLPGVGQNLQDHLLVRVCYAIKQQQPIPMIISETSLFTHTRHGTQAASPDLQFFFGGFLFPDVGYDGSGLTLAPVTAQQRSVGSVSLRSSNPTDVPVIRHNYLSSEIDLQVLVDGIKLGRELIHAHAFDGLRERELLPGADIKDDAGLAEYIRNTSITDWHPSCTCKMGRDTNAVVDPHLRVRGVSDLRVVDASIMPSITSGNLQATIYMIGEKGVDLIKNQT